MNQETTEGAQELTWAEAHPWLVQVAAAGEEDSVDEGIRYTLDELRFA